MVAVLLASISLSSLTNSGKTFFLDFSICVVFSLVGGLLEFMTDFPTSWESALEIVLVSMTMSEGGEVLLLLLL